MNRDYRDLFAEFNAQKVEFLIVGAYAQHLGFEMRISGSHRIFSRQAVVEILNLQRRKDGTARPYQLRQVRNVIVRYGLVGEDDGN